VQQSVTIPADGACSQTLNFTLTLAPRAALPSTARGPQQGAVPVAGGRGTQPAANAAGGRGRGQTGFQTVAVEQQADTAAVTPTVSAESEAAAVQALLPPG